MILDAILARKRDEAQALRAGGGRARLRALAERMPPARDFAAALTAGPGPRVIAEFKRASPSRGEIRAAADAAAIARAYERAGAAALSILTDGPGFRGSLEDLCRARAATSLPVLRKDFTVDEIQLFEARATGADAALLIVAALPGGQLPDLLACAGAIGLFTLIEVHTQAELALARAAGATIVGVNNRDLRTFETDVEVTRSLLPHARGLTVVSESGIANSATVRELEERGVAAFLVGEALLREPDPGLALRQLRGGA